MAVTRRTIIDLGMATAAMVAFAGVVMLTTHRAHAESVTLDQAKEILRLRYSELCSAPMRCRRHSTRPSSPTLRLGARGWLGGTKFTRSTGKRGAAMRNNGWWFCGLLAVGFVFGLAWGARSQDHDAGHAEHHDVYQTWRTPGSGVSCCNEKKTVDGHSTGDCYPTTAILAPAGAANPDIRGDVWWALLDDGRWLEIPESHVIREINPDEIGSRAHVCIMDGSDVPLCFVPPTGGV